MAAESSRRGFLGGLFAGLLGVGRPRAAPSPAPAAGGGSYFEGTTDSYVWQPGTLCTTYTYEASGLCFSTSLGGPRRPGDAATPPPAGGSAGGEVAPPAPGASPPGRGKPPGHVGA
jgi:hypothetical protein